MDAAKSRGRVTYVELLPPPSSYLEELEERYQPHALFSRLLFAAPRALGRREALFTQAAQVARENGLVMPYRRLFDSMRDKMPEDTPEGK